MNPGAKLVCKYCDEEFYRTDGCFCQECKAEWCWDCWTDSVKKEHGVCDEKILERHRQKVETERHRDRSPVRPAKTGPSVNFSCRKCNHIITAPPRDPGQDNVWYCGHCGALQNYPSRSEDECALCHLDYVKTPNDGGQFCPTCNWNELQREKKEKKQAVAEDAYQKTLKEAKPSEDAMSMAHSKGCHGSAGINDLDPCTKCALLATSVVKPRPKTGLVRFMRWVRDNGYVVKPYAQKSVEECLEMNYVHLIMGDRETYPDAKIYRDFPIVVTGNTKLEQAKVMTGCLRCGGDYTFVRYFELGEDKSEENGFSSPPPADPDRSLRSTGPSTVIIVEGDITMDAEIYIIPAWELTDRSHQILRHWSNITLAGAKLENQDHSTLVELKSLEAQFNTELFPKTWIPPNPIPWEKYKLAHKERYVSFTGHGNVYRLGIFG